MARPLVNIPTSGHRAIIDFYRIAVETGASLTEISRQSGLSIANFQHWRCSRSPSVVNLEAALNVMGYGLFVRPLEDEK